jgi:flavodoxin I
MSKVAVVYWSGTGNTKIMAEEVAKGAEAAGAEVTVLTPSKFDADMVDQFDGIGFGCSSMGVEVLEEGEFEPMFEACEARLKGKKIALFGSYGWGDGEWMRNWEERCRMDGANLVTDYVIANEEPDEQAKEECRALGKTLA